jgi:hypothetical protein
MPKNTDIKSLKKKKRKEREKREREKRAGLVIPGSSTKKLLFYLARDRRSLSDSGHLRKISEI